MREIDTITKHDSRTFAAFCEELLSRGHRMRFRAQGASMRPNIIENDAVIVAPVSDSAVRQGDVLLTQGESGLKVHRVVQQNLSAGTFVTRGDSGQENDPPTCTSLGRVIAVERGGRTITTLGRASRVTAKLNSALLRLKLASMRRLCTLLSFIFPAALLLVICLIANVSPAAAQADLSISQSASAPVVAAGSNVVYTIVVTNNGPNLSQNVVFYENIPANTTFQSIGTVPAGWACTTPAVNGTTPINCTIASLANAATATFTVTLQVNAGTAAETAIQNVTSVTSNTTIDPVASNNTSSTTILVGVTGNADLRLSLSAAPSPVFVSSPLTYSVAVQNLGVANATGTTITDTLPAGVTFVSATVTQGTCTQSAGVVTCNLGTLTASSTATATITVTAPGTSGSLTDTASTTSGVTDPFPSNNSASLVTFVQPQSCATPAQNGAGGTLSGNVNTYYAPSAPVVLSPGGKTVTLGAASGSMTPISIGDLLLVIQMQDATINFTNTGAYGDGTPGDPATGYTNANSSGRYEFVTATNALPTAGGALTFSGAGPGGGLLNTYTKAAYSAGVQGQRTFQVIRVPQYQSATLSSTLAPIAWNGTVGGVLVIDIAGQLTLGGTVSADAQGFRGGAGRQLAGGAGGSPNDYITLATFAANGSKGEGIAGTPRYLANAAISAVINTAVEGLPNGSYARGAPGNAGGGGTDANPAANNENSGGGGGGNGSGGGNGGYAWNTASLGNGFGGAPFPGSVSYLIMGGGGGAGTSNNGTADPANANAAGINSSGAAGGGIIIIHAGAVVGTGTITSNGQTALNVLNDGGGGGGAGGSIELLALSGGLSGATLSANGGNGGNTWLPSAPGTPYPGNRHGPGGGGGGGVILTTTAPASASALPGSNGTSTTIHDAYGATPGLGNGIITTNLGSAGFTQTPGNRPGAQCSIADLVVTNSGTPNPVVPGGNITYTQTVNNNGPQSALNVVFSEAIPSNTTFVSLASPVAWTCTTPAVGSGGNISCTLPSNSINVLSTFTLVVQVGVATPSGTTISDTDSVSSGINDSNLANNTATVNTLVAIPASADIAVTNSAAPSTVAPGANITYTQSLTNNGPSAAATVNFTEAIPTNTTFVSLASPGSWSCSTSLATGLAEAHLRAGHDVIVPQYLGRTQFIDTLDQLAQRVRVEFHEILVLDTEAAVTGRFRRRRSELSATGEAHPQLDVDELAVARTIAESFERLEVVETRRPRTRVITATDGLENAYIALCRVLDANRPPS